jgi:hypothetical protein
MLRRDNFSACQLLIHAQLRAYGPVWPRVFRYDTDASSLPPLNAWLQFVDLQLGYLHGNIEFDFRVVGDGRSAVARYANNSNYRNDSLIRKESMDTLSSEPRFVWRQHGEMVC